MNSQQELLDAINTISQSKDRSCDTPATVLRVEGDTVWVHIDGGADETPVQKTINCSEGETVQVRISNGSAFLVGNASAPPTDDKTANVAHFVAEQADIKAVKAEETATEVKETVEVLEVEVDGKVDIGTSNITHMSSTMYQNANGVNIYNDTLAVGDSYAHIDGDSFDIKEATTAGTIDDVNDTVCASFGKTNSVIQSFRNIGSVPMRDYLELGSNNIRIGTEHNSPGEAPLAAGWEISGASIETYGASNAISMNASTGEIEVAHGGGYIPDNKHTTIGLGYMRISGHITDTDNIYVNLTPRVLISDQILAAQTSYTFTDDEFDPWNSTIDIYDSIFGFSPTSVNMTVGSCTITFSAQSVDHYIRIHLY